MRVHQCLTHSLRKPHHKIKNCNSSNLLKSVTFSPRNPSLQSFNISAKRSVLAWFLQRPLPNNFNDERITCYKQVHAQIVISGLQCDTFLANILLRNYSKANDLDGARKLFDTMSERNLVSWSSLVSMYTKKGYGEEALMVFIGFLKVGNGRPDDYILSSVVCTCTQLGGGSNGGNVGEQMHSLQRPVSAHVTCVTANKPNPALLFAKSNPPTAVFGSLMLPATKSHDFHQSMMFT